MADILIRGMENIPVGLEFVIVENIDFERYLYNRETGAAFHLVPLPKGHGRLGDLDKLEENLRMVAAYQTGERQQGMLGCCETVRMAKTIVPAEGGADK